METTFTHQCVASSSSTKYTHKVKKMDFFAFTFLLSAVLLLVANSDAAQCGKGWTHYKDGLCLKYTEQSLSFPEASDYCSGQHNSTLVMVKDSDLQLFLTSTEKISDNIWLGARYKDDAEEFRWDDGTPVSYTDWEVGHPKIIIDSENCIELNPADDSLAINVRGKWASVNCSKTNLVICQRTFQSVVENDMETMRENLASVNGLIETITTDLQKTKNDLENANAELLETKSKLQAEDERSKSLEIGQRELNITLRQSLENSRKNLQNIIPIGYIYIEFSGQPAPQTIWPECRWVDVSSNYAGLFFRTVGGSAGSWGATQEACAPRFSQAQYNWGKPNSFPRQINVPGSGWSPNILAGGFSTHPTHEALRFYIESCEVRPKNQAIRLWKRTA